MLDTHVFLWWDEGARLAAAARSAIEAADEVLVSAASAWEIAIKTSLGRLHPIRNVAQAVEECGFVELPVLISHTEAVSALPWHHRDPFDRILVAQAMVEGLTVVTRDPAISQYGVRVIAA